MVKEKNKWQVNFRLLICGLVLFAQIGEWTENGIGTGHDDEDFGIRRCRLYWLSYGQ